MEILVAAISRATKLKDPEVRWVVSQFTALFFSILLRRYLKPTKESATLRYFLQLVIGVSIVLFSFGWGILHFLVDATVCYILTVTLDPKYCQLFVTFFSVSYMSAIHLYFLFTNVGVNTLDYIGPLMVITEKLSSLSWSIHDGLTRKEEDLNELQKKMVVREYPSFLQFSSFIFCPQNLLVGPVTFYADYCKFIDGETFLVKEKDGRGNERLIYREPSVFSAVAKKLAFTVLSAICLMKLVPMFPIMGNVDEDHIANNSFLYRLGWLWISIQLAKSKYYTAWVLSDAVNNAAGLGFNGYDERGNPKWDGVTNVRIWEFETATSLKVLIDNWNLTGARWLRHVCFDRMPVQKKVTTFLLSSIWHGFHPGYFFTFGSASFMVAASQKVVMLMIDVKGHSMAVTTFLLSSIRQSFYSGYFFTFGSAGLMLATGKKVRANFRHYFTSSPGLKTGYDLFTWFWTHLCLAYFIAPFTFLRFDLCIRYFNSLYWFLHIMALVALIVLPGRKKRTKQPPHSDKTNGVSENNHTDVVSNHHKAE